MSSVFGQGNGFTYQGNLNSGTGPANGLYDFTFQLFNAQTLGIGVQPVVTNLATGVTNGLFTVTLNFPDGVFTGTSYWLEIGVRTNGASAFTILSPRQALTPTPYALFSPTAGVAESANSVSAEDISGMIPLAQLPNSIVTNDATNLNLTGTFNIIGGTIAGNGSGITNLPSGQVITNGSTSVQISNALAQGGRITFQPGDYSNIANIVLTNNTVLSGYGGVTLHFAPGCTGFMLDESTNIRNCAILGIRFTGDAFPNFASSAFISPYNSSYPWNFIPWYIGQHANTFTNRSGLRMNFSGNNVTRDCKFDGFGGWGVMGVGTNDLTQAGANAAGAFMGNIVCSNWVNFGMISFNYDYGIPGQVPGSGIGNNLEGEYAAIVGNHFDAGGIGYYCSCGNVVFSGNELSGNYINLYGWGNQNPGHGTTVANTFNHAAGFGLILYQTQLDINGNQFLADPYFVWDGSTASAFVNNHIGGSPATFIVTNSQGTPMGAVTIKDNRYDGTFAASIATNFNIGPAPNGGSVVFTGNFSENISGDNDGSAESLIVFAHNGGGLTNINAGGISGGLTTNIVVGGQTLHFTNGVLSSIQ